MADEADGPDLEALARLEESFIREFSHRGVVRAERTMALSAPFLFSVWLGTETDRQRDDLASDPDLESTVRHLAQPSGLSALVRGVVVESQETVDRDYEGRWFYRLR